MSQVIKILVVTDGSGGFLSGVGSDREFHLGDFLDVLNNTAWEGFTIQVTKAHRENKNAGAIGADLINFDFAAHDLSQYDEILLFPILSDNVTSNATDAEVAAIAKFMDAGGGVFATGDHEDLGAGLCARLPRIRNMRRWYWPNAGPNGEPPAPIGTPGRPDELMKDRHDTLRAGHDYDLTHPNDNYQFNDQSDNIAQPISPRIFETRSSRYIRQRWPHPLLCSPEGMVRYLPDHAHEGECEVPANLGLRVTVAGYDEEEYPFIGGSRHEPVVVADATVIGGHPTYDPDKPAVNGKTFGVIGAYDGHPVLRAGKRLGRVVVDATWHHFFNINLTGEPFSIGTPKGQGFNAPLNPGQADHYKMIKHYFRNIVYWLIPYQRRLWVFHHTLARMVRGGQFYELNPVRDFDRIDLSKILALGHLADAYFTKAHGACWSLQLLPIILYEFDPLRRIWERLEPQIDPWLRLSSKPEPEPMGLQPEMFADVMLGSTALAVLRAKAELGEDSSFDQASFQRSMTSFEKHLPNALMLGVELFGQRIEAQSEQLAGLTAEFKRVGRR